MPSYVNQSQAFGSREHNPGPVTVHGPKPTRDGPTVEHVVLEHAKVPNKTFSSGDGRWLRQHALSPRYRECKGPSPELKIPAVWIPSPPFSQPRLHRPSVRDCISVSSEQHRRSISGLHRCLGRYTLRHVKDEGLNLRGGLSAARGTRGGLRRRFLPGPGLVATRQSNSRLPLSLSLRGGTAPILPLRITVSARAWRARPAMRIRGRVRHHPDAVGVGGGGSCRCGTGRRVNGEAIRQGRTGACCHRGLF